MELFRLSDNNCGSCSQHSKEAKIIDYGGMKAQFLFHRFGNGTHRLSDFRVYAGWSDVKTLIGAYAKAGNEEAQIAQASLNSVGTKG